MRSPNTFFAPTMRTGKDIDPIIKAFQTLASTTFKDNLVFGFVFGSAATGKLKIKGQAKDDLDTFICLREKDQAAVEAYLSLLAKLHARYHLAVDTTYPAEIMTLEELQATMNSLHEVNVSIHYRLAGKEYDKLFWAHALTNKKVGMIGDGREMSKYIKLCSGYITQWSQSIIAELRAASELPGHIKDRFPGLNQKDAIDKLNHHTPHLIIHLGLQYEAETSMAFTA